MAHVDVGQNPVPPVNLKVDGHPKNTTWLVGFDPYPYWTAVIKSIQITFPASDDFWEDFQYVLRAGRYEKCSN